MAKSLRANIYTAKTIIGFVLTIANVHIDGNKDSITSLRYARGAEKNMLQTNINKPNTVKIVGIEEDTQEDVFNMEVDDNHNFAINGGLVVHNCMDDTRYFVKTMKVAIPKTQYTPSYM